MIDSSGITSSKRFSAMRALYTVSSTLALLIATSAPLHAQTWTLQWSDEFNGAAGAAPDSTKWTYDTGGGGWGNGELETYCSPYSRTAPCDPNSSNIYQDGSGNLIIKAINNGGTWTSGRMNTSGKEAFQYGRIEARMKLQVADGFWPAFWMLGNNIGSVGWPASGEQDIMEWVQSYGPNKTSSTVHGPGYSGANGIGSQFTFPNGGRVDDASYHTYGVIWTQNMMQFYRDNPEQPYFTITPSNIPAGTQWVFNQPFYLLLNLAIGGGGFPGTTDGSTPSTGTILVDYVRVYQPGSTIDSSAWYTVSNQNSGACVDAASWGTANGTIAQQWSCGGSQYNQEWQLTPTDSGYYTITNRNAALVWDVTGGPSATASGALIQLWGSGGGTNQQWMPVSNGNGTYKFVARNSGLCLDVPSASTANGVQLQQYTCNGTAAQSFILTQQP
ncbi:RICIN domain-containing protein [Paraburkholderia megapolitana]|uniref:Beta-glucanase, GH16 family n=1 Tax=Paraburkholderia megapolitana TaxID=420953 RepID=A0A1I3QAB0_9BURK|nr:RICIN domain-containing protein [Paraburkholderia megapolitana]QDQ81159.1 family 16 glycosylhydrolase [Paraburkholderia megapolitana]SFJ30482.1 Beta-glucanase, GH16 family [Paraburkholderia megapolitana]